MQIKKGQKVVGFYFPTTHYHHKMLNIKLGTIVHLKTCVAWLIRPCWLSDFIWSRPSDNAYPTAHVPCPTHRRLWRILDLLHGAILWQALFCRGGRQTWRSRHSTATKQLHDVGTFTQDLYPPVLRLYPPVLRLATALLEKAALAGEWRRMARRT